jgi:hypothetical protein
VNFSINSRQIATYVLLPGIIPRLRAMFGMPFGFLAYLFATCFDMARLMPRFHPYLNPENFGTYGVFDVLRVASTQLKFDLKHIDQVLMFFAILAGWVLFVVFFGLTFVYGLMTPAYAMPVNTSALLANIYQYTATPNPQKDIALMMLDRTLGITGAVAGTSFFGSAIPTMCGGLDLGAATCTTPDAFPTRFQIGMHALLSFYSFAVLCVAALMLSYFILVLVMESNLTGAPMGRRFNKFWMPIRIVAALGMLIPLDPHGLNTAQYIVLYTAKISSAFATNGWIYYNQLTDANMTTAGAQNPAGMPQDYNWDPQYGPTIANSSPLAVKLNAPDMGDLVRFLHLVTACEYFYERTSPRATPGNTWAPSINVQGYFIRPGQATLAAYDETGGAAFQSYANALTFYNYGSIRIVFGHYDVVKYPDEIGNVKPLCGELVIPVTSIQNPATGAIDNPGAAYANEYYYNYIQALLDKTTYYRQLMDGFASQMVENYVKMDNQNRCLWDTDNNNIINYQDITTGSGANLPELGDCHYDPPITYLQYQIEGFQSVFQALVNGSNAELANPANFSITTQIIERGWAGAGIWYNRVASLNGSYVSSVQQIPYGGKMPKVLEIGTMMSSMGNQNVANVTTRLNIDRDKNSDLLPEDREFAIGLNKIYAYLFADSAMYSFKPDPTGVAGVSGNLGFIQPYPNQRNNPVLDAVNMVLGSEFLFSFRDNQNTHPLVQLTAFGRTLLERSARNLLTGSALSAMGGVINLGNADIGSSLIQVSSFFVTIASIFFMAGFTLYYVLPLLPFIYFFFAMLSWVKAIFEALIGAPLWALAHMRLKGEGFPSGPSLQGYLLLLEIFIRPIATVFALIAALGIFTASVYAINDLMDVLIYNAAGRARTDIGTGVGFNPTGSIRGEVDKLFYNILYIILVYMFANSSFQLIDKIPNSFMRWFGGGMKSFAAEAYRRDSPASSFTKQANYALAYPVSGMMNQTDDVVSGLSGAAAGLADTASGGKIRESIISVFGPDRATRMTGIVDDVLKGHKTDLQTLDKLNADLAKPALRNQRAEILEQIKEIEARIDSKDPELLIMEMKKPGSSGMSQRARELAQVEIEKIKKAEELGTGGQILDYLMNYTISRKRQFGIPRNI